MNLSGSGENPMDGPCKNNFTKLVDCLPIAEFLQTYLNAF